MKSDLDRAVEKDVKKVEVPIGQDVDFSRWHIQQAESLQQARREIRLWQIVALVVVTWLIIAAVILAGMAG